MNYFVQVSENHIFCEFHPVQETNKINNQIFSSKNGINKQWFSYHKEELALYCSQCLSFSSSNSIFVKGMKDVLHIFIRVSSYRESVASYITWRNIHQYFYQQNTLKKNFAPENRNSL